MDAAEFLERVEDRTRQPWEQDRLTEGDWKRIEHDRPLRMLADPWPMESRERQP